MAHTRSAAQTSSNSGNMIKPSSEPKAKQQHSTGMLLFEVNAESASLIHDHRDKTLSI